LRVVELKIFRFYILHYAVLYFSVFFWARPTLSLKKLQVGTALFRTALRFGIPTKKSGHASYLSSLLSLVRSKKIPIGLLSCYKNKAITKGHVRKIVNMVIGFSTTIDRITSNVVKLKLLLF